MGHGHVAVYGNRCDVMPLFADALGFSQLVEELTDQLTGVEFEAVAAVDALGFTLGTAIAVKTRRESA
jgi:adenine/guanine phosphoribosyltransferase-like PRPP-binding protein